MKRLLLITSFVIARLCVAAQKSNLDPSFGEYGKTLTTFESYDAFRAFGGQILEQNDGKILVGAGGGIARYQRNGSLDESFGYNGYTQAIGIGGRAVVQPNGKMVVLGSVDGNMVLGRFTANGIL